MDTVERGGILAVFSKTQVNFEETVLLVDTKVSSKKKAALVLFVKGSGTCTNYNPGVHLHT